MKYDKSKYIFKVVPPTKAKSIDKRVLLLTRSQIIFLQLCCTQMTYEEIADCMARSRRTIDGYRDDCFRILRLRNRSGLIIFAIQNGIIDVNKINLYE